MTTAVPAAGWTGALLGLAASLVLAVLGFRAQRQPESVGHRQLRIAVWCMLGGAALSMLALAFLVLQRRRLWEKRAGDDRAGGAGAAGAPAGGARLGRGRDPQMVGVASGAESPGGGQPSQAASRRAKASPAK